MMMSNTVDSRYFHKHLLTKLAMFLIRVLRLTYILLSRTLDSLLYKVLLALR